MRCKELQCRLYAIRPRAKWLIPELQQSRYEASLAERRYTATCSAESRGVGPGVRRFASLAIPSALRRRTQLCRVCSTGANAGLMLYTSAKVGRISQGTVSVWIYAMMDCDIAE